MRRDTREAIEQEILAWMRVPSWEGSEDEDRFQTLALRLFAFQFESCEPFRRYCKARGVDPKRIRDWREIPSVPTGAFKEVELRCFPASATRHRFRTSGTSTEKRGTLHLDSLALYEASLLPTFRHFILPDLAGSGQWNSAAQGDPAPAGRTTLRILAPSPLEAPDSSLSHMFGRVLAALGDAESGFDVVDGQLREAPLLRALESATRDDRPVTLCGTAFAFVHLLEHLEERGLCLRLPAASRVMETGGFKGRSRELERDALYAGLEGALGVPAARIVNQYGMTELGSQFYDSVLADPGMARCKLGPPWARVRILDPRSGNEVTPGEAGVVHVFDLANTGSVAALATADLGRRLGGPLRGQRDQRDPQDRRGGGFELLGRDPGAEARGCSIAADDMLGSAP